MRPCLLSRFVVLFLAFSAFFWLALPQVFVVRATIDGNGVDTGESYSTNPKSRSPKVTATVVDNTAPSVPILVSPENNALLSTNLFPFVWKQSTDALGIKKYQLYVDGSLVLDNIGPENENTSIYKHFGDAGVSTLTFYSALSQLTDGVHTWKIRAFDNNGNTADSATWSFTIDTAAPEMVITAIGNLTVSLSSQDPTTIPNDPYLLYDNEPVITGQTEASATVQLTISIPGEPVTTLTTTAATDGSFSFTLPVLPRDVTIMLSFVARDAAENTSVINDVPLIIATRYISAPAPFSKVIPPIPVPEIQEVREQIAETIKEALKKILPDDLVDTLSDTLDYVSPVANSLLGLVIPTGRALIALHFTGVALSSVTPRLFKRILEALYLLPPGERLGLVFDERTHKGVPFALVSIYAIQSIQDKDKALVGKPVVEVVADSNGLYGPISLPRGQYTLEVSQKDYTYLGRTANNQNSDSELLYSGEIFVVDSASQKIDFLIPMTATDELQRYPRNAQLNSPHAFLFNKFSLWFSRLPTGVLIPATLVMFLITFFYFTIWNALMFFAYLWTCTRRAARKLKLPTLVGGVVDRFGDPMPLAVVHILPIQKVDRNGRRTKHHGVTLQTDLSGKYAVALPRGAYNARACWFDGSCTSWIALDVQKHTAALAFSMKR